jgi:hypothetical protein
MSLNGGGQDSVKDARRSARSTWKYNMVTALEKSLCIGVVCREVVDVPGKWR